MDKRLNQEKISAQSQLLQDIIFFTKAFDAMKVPVMIINQSRQVVFANRAFLETPAFKSEAGILGKRPGEVIGCIHAQDAPGGCGTGDACASCSALDIILRAMESIAELTGEASISQTDGEQERTLNFMEHVVPIQVAGENFYIISMLDISDTVARRLLEKIFFHDLLNTSGALWQYVSLLKDEAPEQMKLEMNFVEETCNDLVEQIQSQRQLLEAENGELVPEMMPIESMDLLNSVQRLFQKRHPGREEIIIKDDYAQSINFQSDYSLLKRVLVNMLKNALEETDAGVRVEVGCRRIITDREPSIEFWVRNQGFIPKDRQYQVFKRGYSTKGKGRGLGTYSMKLLGERYLGGQVGFSSDETDGTIFYIRLPLKKEDSKFSEGRVEDENFNR